MDQTTQQNAAMVEETNAASLTLADEARGLRQLISQFNLGHQQGYASQLRATAAKLAEPAAKTQPAARTQMRTTEATAPATAQWSEF